MYFDFELAPLLLILLLLPHSIEPHTTRYMNAGGGNSFMDKFN
jgi:hypothetical protein